MKTAVGTLKGDLSQFRELESFAAFGSELDKVSQAQLDRGYRLVELLKQPLNSPMPVEEQVVSLYTATHGDLDLVPVTEVRRFEDELLEWFRQPPRRHPRCHRTDGDIPDVEASECHQGIRRAVLLGAGRRRGWWCRADGCRREPAKSAESGKPQDETPETPESVEA